ncbi:MAG TPA: ribonuclease HI family protein [Vitreimonas sp.]|nr:ribonuclease HI family protein [Vitreimonas sp.]
MSTLTIFTDGGSRGNPGPAALGVHVIDDHGQTVFSLGKPLGVGTNNEAEYQAFVTSVGWLLASEQLAQTQKVIWKLDSKLVVEQLLKHWQIKEPRMLALAQQAWASLQQLSCDWDIVHIPRAENKVADALVNRALDLGQEV